MKINLFLILFLTGTLFLTFGHTNTGKTIQGPRTLGQQTYPNSGQLRNRSNDMTGKDMSNATLMGSDVDPTVPSRTPVQGSRANNNAPKTFKEGPFKDTQQVHIEEGPDGERAQRAAKEGKFDISKKAQNRKQQGL